MRLGQNGDVPAGMPCSHEPQRHTIAGSASGKKACSSGHVYLLMRPCTASVSMSRNSKNVKHRPSGVYAGTGTPPEVYTLSLRRNCARSIREKMMLSSCLISCVRTVSKDTAEEAL